MICLVLIFKEGFSFLTFVQNKFRRVTESFGLACQAQKAYRPIRLYKTSCMEINIQKTLAESNNLIKRIFFYLIPQIIKMLIDEN